MNCEEMGKFILNMRKEKNLTQAELGQMLNVRDKAVSKWERGICCPDIFILEQLANTLGVTIPELTRGERIKNITNETINSATQDNIIYFTKKARNRIVIVSAILLMFFIATTLFVINNYGKIEIFELKGLENEYTATGNVILTNERHIITLSNLMLLNDRELLIDKWGYSFEYTLYLNERLIFRNGNIDTYMHFEDNPLINVSDFIRQISIYITENERVDEYIAEENMLMSNITLSISYLDEDLKQQRVDFDFALSRVFTNDRLFYRRAYITRH